MNGSLPSLSTNTLPLTLTGTFMAPRRFIASTVIATSCIGLISSISGNPVLAQQPAASVTVISPLDPQAWNKAVWMKLNPGVAVPVNVTLPANAHLFKAGQLGLALRVDDGGIELISLYDLSTGQELAAEKPMPLFVLKVNPQDLAKEAVWDANTGWARPTLRKLKNGLEVTLTRAEADTKPLAVVVSATADDKTSAWKWNIKVQNTGSRWSVNEVLFPQIALADLGPDSKAIVPRGAGKLYNNPVEQKVAWNDTYGNGSCTMQWMAAYREGNRATGLYVGRHDPQAVLKGMHLNANNELGGTQIHFNQPAENPLTPGNGFNYSGEGVWQLLRGDWFDGAQIYKTWAAKNAVWWPKLTNDGRPDTPLWYREIDVWTNLNSRLIDVQPAMLDFQKRMGVPVAFQWVLWQTKDFDNDYPHFFPAIPNFRETTAKLQASDMHVVPHINGRLWDTRDRGTTDFEYTSKALPWTTKVFKDGKIVPLTENYFGKEADGSDIYLGVMCPASKMWQDTIAEVIRKLTQEEGVHGAYLDQVAATAAVPCLDPNHGHPLGGGGWWRAAYQEMFAKTRRVSSKDTILTTECNAEQYANIFDGFLTLHWQEDNQVPAFPAVYGGVIQMFGRLYTTPEDLDLRMKAGQELVYGGQIGWVRDDLKLEKVSALSRQYFQDLVHTRHKIHRYIYAGEMARPPKLETTLPTVTADWKWAGKVTSEVVMTGAWKKRGENKLLFLFTNVSDKPVETAFRLDPAQYNIPSRSYNLSRWMGPNGTPTQTTASGTKLLPVSLPPASVMVVEASWK